MRGQSHQNYCGPATIANLLRALRISKTVNENEIAKKVSKISSVTEPNPAQGTFETQILKVLNSYKLKAEPFTLHTPHPAVCVLRDNLRLGRPVALCVDNDSHWLAAIGLLGTNVVIADSADNEIVSVYSELELAGRWETATDPKRYYGIIVHPKATRSK